MNPEEGFRLFNEPDQWNLELRERPGVFAAKRPVPAFVRAAFTVGGVAVAAVLVVVLFTVGVRSIRTAPVAPASPSPTATFAGYPTPDDGAVMPAKFREMTQWENAETQVALGSNLSLPWAVNVMDRDSSALYIAYDAGGPGGDCGGHLGVEVIESATSVTIAAVSNPIAAAAACTAPLYIDAGRVDLAEPLGQRLLFHAPLSSPVAPGANPIGATLADPSILEYDGAATCENLIDDSTRSLIANRGYVDVATAYDSAGPVENGISITDFIRNDGLLCSYGVLPTPDTPFELGLVYGYGPLPSKAEATERAALDATGLYAVSTMDGIDYYVYDDGDEVSAVAFGDGYWAAAMHDSVGSVLDELVVNAPAFGQVILQSDLYVTSEGLGDIRIGQPISQPNDVVEWEPQSCTPWINRAPFDYASHLHTVLLVETKDDEEQGTVSLIWIRSPEIPTKSGLRVGDTTEKLTSTFPNLGEPVATVEASESFAIDGAEGVLLFDVADDHITGIRVVPSGTPLTGALFVGYPCST